MSTHFIASNNDFSEAGNESYFYQIERKSRTLELKQYIHYLGPYRYNWHKDIEIMLILKGKVEVNCDGEIFSLEENDLLMIPSNAGHATLAKDVESIAMVLRLHPSYLKEYFENPDECVFYGYTTGETRNRKNMVMIRGIMTLMMEHGSRPQPMDKLMYEYELNYLLFLLFSEFPPLKQQQEKRKRKTKKEELQMISSVIRYVEEHYSEKINLKDAAEICSYNSSYLSSFFKKHVGVNFYDYVTRTRLREATIELADSNYSLLTIANRNGFADLKSFNTSFQKTFHKSPKAYRKELLSERQKIDLKRKRQFVLKSDQDTKERLAAYAEVYNELVSAREEAGYILHIKKIEEICSMTQELSERVQALR